MSIFLNILITGAIAIASTIGAYNYLPLSFIEQFGPRMERKLGATITTIAGTDTIKNSRATINTNFANLNSEVLGVLTPARLTATSTSATSTIQFGLEIYQGALAVGTTATTTIRTAATSSFSGGISTTGTIDSQGSTATSTFANGISLANGCVLLSTGGCLSALDLTVSNVWTSASTTFVNGVSTGNSTSTNATTTNLQVSGHASTTNATIGALGVGVSTSTQRNLQVAGMVQIGGTLNVGGDQIGAIKFLATPRNSVTRTTYTSGTFADIDITSTTTPDTARFAIINARLDVTEAAVASGEGAIVAFRQNGSSVTANLLTLTAMVQVNNIENRASGMFIVPLDSSQIFEYDVSGITGDTPDTLNLVIDTVGFIK